MSAPALLSIADAARYLGLCTRSVQSLVADGRLACYRIGPDGGRVRFSVADLDVYVARCRCVGGKVHPANGKMAKRT